MNKESDTLNWFAYFLLGLGAVITLGVGITFGYIITFVFDKMLGI
jgi:hypothetical protein